MGRRMIDADDFLQGKTCRRVHRAEARRMRHREKPKASRKPQMGRLSGRAEDTEIE
jgi:hypothetical protein